MLYVGSCPNIKNRLKKHIKSFVKSTKNRRPLKLIYFETYTDRDDAIKREKYLKGGKGKSELKIQLKNTLKNNKYSFI
jgi:putative endonuclease